VDQDDVVTSGGIGGFDAPIDLSADNYFVRGVRLPYFKFRAIAAGETPTDRRPWAFGGPSCPASPPRAAVARRRAGLGRADRLPRRAAPRGYPQEVLRRARPSDTGRYVGNLIGGGNPFARRAQAPADDEGTWGWDFVGGCFRRRGCSTGGTARRRAAPAGTRPTAPGCCIR